MAFESSGTKGWKKTIATIKEKIVGQGADNMTESSKRSQSIITSFTGELGQKKKTNKKPQPIT